MIDEIYEYLKSKNVDTSTAMNALLGEVSFIAEAQVLFEPQTKQDTYLFLKDRMNLILKHLRQLNPKTNPNPPPSN